MKTSFKNKTPDKCMSILSIRRVMCHIPSFLFHIVITNCSPLGVHTIWVSTLMRSQPSENHQPGASKNDIGASNVYSSPLMLKWDGCVTGGDQSLKDDSLLELLSSSSTFFFPPSGTGASGLLMMEWRKRDPSHNQTDTTCKAGAPFSNIRNLNCWVNKLLHGCGNRDTKFSLHFIFKTGLSSDSSLKFIF